MSSNKYCLFPIGNSRIYQAYQTLLEAFWVVDEVDLSKDRADLDKMKEEERQFLFFILAFFAQSDGLVGENLARNLYLTSNKPETRLFYGLQLANEGVHSEMYSKLIDTYVQDHDLRDKLFNAIETMECVARKANWALNWINNGTMVQQIVANAIVEGVFFSGSFCAIYWFRDRKMVPGLGVANDWIARDEGLHCEFAVINYEEEGMAISDNEFESMIREAVLIEKNFISEALPASLIGMNSALMSQYIEYVADRLAMRFGKKKIYKAVNPFEFMRLLDVENKTNFFERRPSEYKKSNFLGADKTALAFDAEF